MPRWLPSLVLCLLLVVPTDARPAPSATDPVDLPLLLRMLAANTPDLEELLEERIASFTMVSVVEELDGKGRVKHTKRRVSRVSEEGGKRKSVLVLAQDDGRDVTARQRRELREKGQDADLRKNEKDFAIRVPFTAASQPLHRFELAGRDARDPSKVRIRFEPAGRAGTDVMTGEALVDPTTGMLVSLRFRPTRYTSWLIKNLEVSMTFRAVPGVGAVVQHIVGRGDGGLLFVRKHQRATVTFSEVVFKRPVAPVRAAERHDVAE